MYTFVFMDVFIHKEYVRVAKPKKCEAHWRLCTTTIFQSSLFALIISLPLHIPVSTNNIGTTIINVAKLLIILCMLPWIPICHFSIDPCTFMAPSSAPTYLKSTLLQERVLWVLWVVYKAHSRGDLGVSLYIILDSWQGRLTHM